MSHPSRPGRLAGRTALISGAAAGIGAACARVFAAEGARLCLLDRDAEALERSAAALLDEHPAAALLTCCADVADSVAVQAAVDACLARFGGLEVLVANAAVRHHGAVADASDADWQRLLAVNLGGTAACCRAALPALRRSGRGSIVVVSSCHAVSGRAGMGLYDASKAAQLALVRTLAHEEAVHGVRANAVLPGPTLTEFQFERARRAGQSLDALRDARRHTTLLGRWAEPQEIAWPILWLAGDEASYITGTQLLVDGGLAAM